MVDVETSAGTHRTQPKLTPTLPQQPL